MESSVLCPRNQQQDGAADAAAVLQMDVVTVWPFPAHWCEKQNKNESQSQSTTSLMVLMSTCNKRRFNRSLVAPNIMKHLLTFNPEIMMIIMKWADQGADMMELFSPQTKSTPIITPRLWMKSLVSAHQVTNGMNDLLNERDAIKKSPADPNDLWEEEVALFPSLFRSHTLQTDSTLNPFSKVFSSSVIVN